MSRATYASSHPKDHKPHNLQSTDAQAHASSRATECRSLYYKVDRSDHYTAPSFASRGASQHQIGNDRIASAACLPTPGSAYNPAMNGTVTGQLQTTGSTSVFDNSSTPGCQTSSSQSYSPMQRWEDETIQEQAWNGIEYYRALDDKATDYETKSGYHPDEATSTSAQRGVGNES